MTQELSFALITSGYEAINRSPVFIYNIDQCCGEWTKSLPLIFGGQQFIDWLISADGQQTIANYKIEGEQLFYPNANDPTA